MDRDGREARWFSPKRLATALRALVIVLATPAGALAQSHACLGRGETTRVLDEVLLAVVNPEGFENQLHLGVCTPISRRPGLLYEYTQLEAGLINYVGPIYTHLGGYLSIVPLSFLELKVEVAGVAYWPLPPSAGFDGAGYFSRPAYNADYRDSALPRTDARAAGGLDATFSATLRLAAPLGRRLQVLVFNTFGADAWFLGDGPYYFNVRRDLVLARGDVLLKNTAQLLLEVAARDAVRVRLGATDDLSYVPGSGYLANIVGFFGAVLIRRAGTLREIEPFVRAGGYTEHAFRRGFQLMIGLSMTWAWAD